MTGCSGDHGRPAGAFCAKCQGCQCVTDPACPTHSGTKHRATLARVARHLRWASADPTISHEARMVLQSQAAVVEAGDLCTVTEPAP